MNIEDLTVGEARQIAALFGAVNNQAPNRHPMVGRRCLVRTYSAGVHIGTVTRVEGMECLLTDALRLWKWEGGGLSLSAVASNGIKGGRLNRTGEVYLTNCIEFIPTTIEAEESYVRFIEDQK
jgi:hypothetical protein